MDSRNLIYEHISSNVQDSTISSLKDCEPFIKSFVKNILPNSDQGNIDETFRKTYSLVGLKTTRQKRRHHHVKGTLSLSERRRLGLYQLRRHGSNYSDAAAIHRLWQEYVTTLLSLPELKKNGFTAQPSDKMFEQVSLTLYRADYHGAEIEVVRSKCSSLLGLKGIVLMETKNTFKLIGKDNIIRTVPKTPCAFSFSLGGFRFTIFGKYFCAVPAHRSTKKAKGSCLLDI